MKNNIRSSIFIAVTSNLLLNCLLDFVTELIIPFSRFHSYLHTLVINHPFHNPTFQPFAHSFTRRWPKIFRGIDPVAVSNSLPSSQRRRQNVSRENFKRQRRNEINKAFLFFWIRSFSIHPKPFCSWHCVALEKAFGLPLPRGSLASFDRSMIFSRLFISRHKG